MPDFDRQRAADVLVDAHLLGTPRAAEKWGVTARTIRNYQTRLEDDVEFARLYAVKLKRAEEDWRTERLRFLRNGLAKLDELVGKATDPVDIGPVAQAVKVVGELQVASDVLHVGDGADQSDPEPPEAPGDPPAGSGEVH